MHQSNLRQPPRQNSGFEPQGGYARQVPQRPANQAVQRPNANHSSHMQQPVLQHGVENTNQTMVNHRPMQPNQLQNGANQPTRQQNRHQPQSAPDNAKLDRPDWFLQLNTYGNKCAFQIENSQTKDGWFTINIESAQRENPNDPNNKRYLWNEKTVLQMTKTELPVFAAVLLGMLPSARFDNHGNNSKFLEIINQEQSLFFKTGGVGLNLHVAPVPTVEGFLYGTMALTQYARNFNGLTTESAMDIISRLANQLFNHGGYKQAQVRK